MPIRRQTTLEPLGIKVRDDLLFVGYEILEGNLSRTTYRCIHIPTLVISTQLPDGSLDLTENAFAGLRPRCKMGAYTMELRYMVHTDIYSIPSCLSTHPRYCFIFRPPGQSAKTNWEILEVEIDLRVPGPIKIFSKVSRQYTVMHQTQRFHCLSDDLLLSIPSEYGHMPRAPPGVHFLRVGKPDDWRVVKLGGVDKMRFWLLDVDKDAGYIIAWAEQCWPWRTHERRSFIWWIDKRKPGQVVHLKDLITGWCRGLLRGF